MERGGRKEKSDEGAYASQSQMIKRSWQSQMQDEDIDKLSGKEYKEIIMKLYQDNEKWWEELTEFKNHIITERNQIQT